MVWFVAVTTFVLGLCLGMCLVGRREPVSAEAVPSSTHDGGDDKRFSVTFRVEGTSNTVMNVLTSFSRYPEWIGDVRECAVYSHNDNEVRVRMVTPILWFTIATHLVHTITDDSMTWHLDTDYKNMFRVNEGRWHVRDAEDGTCVVTYSVHIEPTPHLPSHLNDFLKREASRRAVEWLPRALRQTVPDVDVPRAPWFMRCFTCVPGNKNVS